MFFAAAHWSTLCAICLLKDDAFIFMCLSISGKQL